VRQKDQESIAGLYLLLEVPSEGNRGGAQQGDKGQVDTGASFLFMPESDALVLGLRFARRERFAITNSSVIERPVYWAAVEIEGKAINTEVVGGAPGEPVPASHMTTRCLSDA